VKDFDIVNGIITPNLRHPDVILGYLKYAFRDWIEPFLMG